MIVVAHALGGTLKGGVFNMVLNFNKELKDTCKFIYLVMEDYADPNVISQLEKLDAQVVIVPNFRNFIRYIFFLLSFYYRNKIDVVHVHNPNIGIFDIFFSMCFGVRNRIIHSHSTVFSAKIINYYINKFISKFLNIFSTNKVACSKQAGIVKFNNNKFQVIFNGIDINQYKFSFNDRRLYREKFGLDENDIILGHVGAFNSIKNQDFIVGVFDELLKIKKNYVLFLVGDGNLKDKVISKVKELNLEKKVFFLGQRGDVNSLLSMFDIFLFPSKFEGLGISVVEAQAVGLKSIVSENVPFETKVTDIILYIPLERNIWVNKIVDTNLVVDREKYNNIVENSQFNIKYAAKDLLNVYISGSIK